jgi:hypothetical protein
VIRLSNGCNSEGVEYYSLSLSSALSLDDTIESLHFRVRFSDAEAKKEAFRHDVSIQLVKSLVDGNGIEYKPAAEHIALTTSPVIPGLGPWVPDANDPLVATKEVLYPGDFYKKADNLRLPVNQKYLDKLIANVDLMLSNGVPFPLQLGHEGDTTGRGKVLGLFKAPRKQQTLSPTGLSASHRDRATNRFLAIALSTIPTTAPSGNTDLSAMTLDELLAVCGIVAPEGADDAAKIALLKDWFAKAKTAMAASEKPEGNTEGDTPLSQGGVAAPAAPAGPSIAEQLNPRKVQMSVSLSTVKQVQTTGRAMLDQLVLNRHITPAEAIELDKAYNSDDEVRVSLSNEATEPPLMKALRIRLTGVEGTAWSPTGRSEVDPSAAQAALSQKGFAGQQKKSVLLQLLDDEK